ncbi:MAG: hypothetical protein P8180_05935 [Gammaproteobacteria bacterium]|jgi:hypothetical protein
MNPYPSTYSRGQRVGMTVFVLAVVCTAALIALGVSGTPWPKWLLGLTTVL